MAAKFAAVKNTGIEWATHTFNPWIGCTKVSPACDHCYAEKMARRVAGLDAKRQGLAVVSNWGPGSARRPASEPQWREPLGWDRAAEAAGERDRVFCASMADVFEGRADQAAARNRLWGLIEKTPNLDWLLLTKRPNHVLGLVPDSWRTSIPDNVWVGVTVENQECAAKRLPHLLQIPAVVRFISAEPLLGSLDLVPWASSLDWIIMGGESGVERDLRRTESDWYRALVSTAARFRVPLFLKQWGNWTESGHRTQKKNTSHVLDGVEWAEFPTHIAEARRKLAQARRDATNHRTVIEVMET